MGQQLGIYNDTSYVSLIKLKMSTSVINEPRSRCWIIKFPWNADQITHGDLITSDLVHAKVSHAVQRCMVFVKFPSLKRSAQVSTLFPQPYAVVEPSTWGGYSSFKDSPCDYELIIYLIVYIIFWHSLLV